MMFSKILLNHGYFCASHPWEVIVTIITITICSISMAIYKLGNEICGYNINCPNDEKSSDVIILTFTKCVAIFYIYLQFKKLRKLGSKYILGLAGLFTIFSSFIISATAIKLLGLDLYYIKESVPFFLLLIDLSKASTLGKFSLNYVNFNTCFHIDIKSLKKGDINLVNESIAKSLTILGPSFTLDTLVEIMVVGIGTLSGIRTLEIACLFGCIAILVNYFIFMTFYPSCLSLVMQVKSPTSDVDGNPKLATNESFGRPELGSSENLDPEVDDKYVILPRQILVDDKNFWKFSSIFNELSMYATTPFLFNTTKLVDQDEAHLTADSKTSPMKNYMHSSTTSSILGNPVIQRIKIIMSLGLLIVHLHSRFFLPSPSSNSPTFTNDLGNNVTFLELFNDSSISNHSEMHDNDVPVLNARDNNPSATFKTLLTEKDFLLFLVKRVIYLKIQDWFTIVFALLTALHYFYFSQDRKEDKDVVVDRSVVKPVERPRSTSGSLQLTGTLNPNNSSFHKKLSLIIGDCSADYKTSQDKETQTHMNTINGYLKVEKCNPTSAEVPVEEDELDLLDKFISKQISSHNLDAICGDNYEKCIRIRRASILLNSKVKEPALINKENDDALEGIPYKGYPDYRIVNGACCENVIGYIPLPLGTAGPLLLDGNTFHLPMATTEGCLVASTNRGCRAIMESSKLFQNGLRDAIYHPEIHTNGIYSAVFDNGMTRGPIVRFPNSLRAHEVKEWCEESHNFLLIKREFESTSRYLILKSLHSTLAGRRLFLRFKAQTGDAMGMNMISKACDHVLKFIRNIHTDMEIVSLSGNYCTDKKAAAINWIEGRGKSVVCEAVIHKDVVSKVLKTSVSALVDLNENKNLIGSAMAGALGGFNAHAANVVSAIFIATGQDPAQVVSSSNCITIMEHGGIVGQDLLISCTMPCLELGTVGGGTILTAQRSCLKLLGVEGPNDMMPGKNSELLARIICGAVLAGELSLMSALSAGHLVKSHLRYNRF